MLYNHFTLEKEQIKKTLKAQNYPDIHVHNDCMQT